MKLEGSLDAFGLPDVFQLLHATRKTGALDVRRLDDGARGVVHFVAGEITSASVDATGLSLLRHLVARGTVTEELLEQAAQRSADDNCGVVEAVLAIEPDLADEVRAAAEEQAVDAVLDLLRWPDGEFAFSAEALVGDDVGLRLAAATLVESAEKRREQWDIAAERVPSPELIPSLSFGIDSDAVLTPAEWGIIALIDGHRAVRDIVDLTGTGPFAAVTLISDLVERGLVTVGQAHGPASALRRRLDLVAALGDPASLPEPEQELASVEPAAKAAVSEPNSALSDDLVEPVGQGSSTAVNVPAASFSTSAPSPSASHPTSGKAAGVAAPTVRTEDKTDSPQDHGPDLLGGAHTPVNVVPPRPEPFLPRRSPEHPEPSNQVPATTTTVVGANAVAADALVTRDPSVNRSLVLRLIAGVRGL